MNIFVKICLTILLAVIIFRIFTILLPLTDWHFANIVFGIGAIIAIITVVALHFEEKLKELENEIQTLKLRIHEIKSQLIELEETTCK